MAGAYYNWRIGDEQLRKWGYGSLDDITVICDGWGILQWENNIERCDDERQDYEIITVILRL